MKIWGIIHDKSESKYEILRCDIPFPLIGKNRSGGEREGKKGAEGSGRERSWVEEKEGEGSF